MNRYVVGGICKETGRYKEIIRAGKTRSAATRLAARELRCPAVKARLTDSQYR